MSVTAEVAEVGVVTTPEPGQRAGRRTRAPRSTWPRWAIVGARIGLLAAFLILWEVASNNEWIDPRLFGTPSGIWDAFLEYVPSDQGKTSMWSTFTAVIIAFVIGSIVGTLAGLILGVNPTLDAIVGPFLLPLNSVPRIALAPLFITWFGLTRSAKVFLAVTIVFFILAENARSAVKSVDSDLMTMARVTGLGRTGILAKVVLPSAVPSLFAGLRLTWTYSLLGVIASEMIAAPNGIGQDLVFFSNTYEVNTVFAILFGLMFVALLVNVVFGFTERWLLRWQRT
jgi:NitT/TauT family transport system permease protein